MSKKEGLYKIGEIEFMGDIVHVYHDSLTDVNNILCSWDCRNPDSFIKG